jgi:hypothetical protein
VAVESVPVIVLTAVLVVMIVVVGVTVVVGHRQGDGVLHRSTSVAACDDVHQRTGAVVTPATLSRWRSSATTSSPS